MACPTANGLAASPETLVVTSCTAHYGLSRVPIVIGLHCFIFVSLLNRSQGWSLSILVLFTYIRWPFKTTFDATFNHSLWSLWLLKVSVCTRWHSTARGLLSLSSISLRDIVYILERWPMLSCTIVLIILLCMWRCTNFGIKLGHWKTIMFLWGVGGI